MIGEVQTHYLDLDDGRLAFSDYGGSGQAVVMLPGMAALRSEYRFLAQPGRFDAAVALGTCSRQPSDERLEQVKSPTLVVMGAKDPDYPDPAEEGKIVARHTGGKLVMIEGAGHYPQSEIPQATAAAIIEFLNSSSHR